MFSYLKITTMEAKAKEITVQVKGFTFVKDYSAIVVSINDVSTKVILGTKQDFGMQDMFAMKQAESVTLLPREDKVVGGITYKRYSLVCINF